MDDLKNIENDLSGNYILMNDIDLSGINWTPLSEWDISNTYFSGILDGNGHVIKNLTSTHGGLFGCLNGEIKNLGMENVSINSSNSYIGAIANTYLLDNYQDIKITNCYVTGNITGNNSIGGFIGRGMDGAINIENSYFSGNITGASDIGGIIGCFETACLQAKNVYVQGNISGTNSVGGIIGYNSVVSEIHNSYTSVTINGTSNIGAIVGHGGDEIVSSNVYYDKNKTAEAGRYAIGSHTSMTITATGLTSTEMNKTASFVGFDTDIWDFSTKTPTLKNMAKATQTNDIRLQIGASSDPTMNALNIDTALGFDFQEFSYASVENCNAVIEKIDLMLAEINKKNSLIGATQNRLESIVNSQSTQIENYTSAYSTIMDSDVAEESANFVQAQILQQTTSSLLSQAQSIQASVILNMIRSLE